MAKNKALPWAWLDDYRGKAFEGQWPSVTELFAINAERFKDNNLFLSFAPKKQVFTYGEAYKKILEIADYLIENGVKKGDKIGVSGKNSPEWAISYLAVLFSGATVVPLDYALHDHEMEKLISFGGVTRLFIDGERIESIDKFNTLGLVEKISLEEKSNGYKYALDLVGAKNESYPKWDGEDVAAILFTSGTTGTPKGVQLTNNNLVSDCFRAQCYMTLYPTDVFYVILPIHHAYTMLAVFYETFSVGASCVFGKKLVVTQILKDLKLGKVTMFLAVPMLFNKLLAALMDGVRKQGKFKYGLIKTLMAISGFIKKVFNVNIGKKLFGKMLLSKLSLDTNRICISGGGPLPASTFKQFNQLGIDFVQGYGLTETSPITHLNPIDAYEETSVGKLLPGLEQKIVDPDDEGNGVLHIRGSVVMKGYYNNPEATAEVLDADGWLNTGDVGHIDSRGYFYITGRSKSVIVTEGGKNVFPEEIEDLFQLYSEIDQVCIISYLVDKEKKSEGIRCLLYPAKKFSDENSKEAVEKRMNEIVDEVNKNLQSYKKITMTTVIDEPMEMTSTKKIKRFVVAKKYELN